MMKKSERLILYLIKRHSEVTKIRAVKEMFLISEFTDTYSFVPYRYGPFSFEMYHDIRRLEALGYLVQTENSFIYTGLPFKEPDNIDKRSADYVFNSYKDMDDKALVKRVYESHPEFTVFSEYEKKMEYRAEERGITTIGYEGKSLDRFIYELIENKINTVVDVRKNAFSRKYGFSKGELKRTLEKMDIEYMHMPELGIVSDKRRALNTFEDYQKLFVEYYRTLDGKRKSLMKIMELGKKKKIALMCFEADVNYCHRGQIAKWLRNEGAEVVDL